MARFYAQTPRTRPKPTRRYRYKYIYFLFNVIIMKPISTYKLENEPNTIAAEPVIEFQRGIIFHKLPFVEAEKPKFTFIDLFAGIGGIRLAYQNLGGQCVFTSEWDKYSKLTYEANFGEMPQGDITKINENDIPDHDILLGGFPCQPFSIAGVSKKNAA